MADEGGQTTGYYGQMGLTDPGSKFNVTAFIVESMLGRVRTMVVVKVVAVTNDGELSPVGFVDVQPLVKQVDGVGNATPHGTIFGLPYFRLQGGANAVIIDPKVDDIGIAIVADRDSSSVKENKAESTPGSKRRFSLADGFYVGGYLNVLPDQYVRFNDDGVKVADKNGNVVDMTATGITLTPSAGLPVTVNGNVVVTGNFQLAGAFEGVSGSTYAGDLHVSGDVVAKYGTAGGVGLATHRHTQPADSHGDTEAPTNAPTGGT